MDTNFGPLNVTVRGSGEPEVVVIGGVHGDKQSGIRAVRRLREADLAHDLRSDHRDPGRGVSYAEYLDSTRCVAVD